MAVGTVTGGPVRLYCLILLALVAIGGGGLVVLRGTSPELASRNYTKKCIDAVKDGKVSFWVSKLGARTICTAYGESVVLHKTWQPTPVPEIIHQSWKNTMIPDNFKVWSTSWKKVNPTWEYWFWTDEDNRELVERDYPEFLEAYDSMAYGINRADMVRGLYMHKYGGVYADLDTWCLRPMDQLVTENKAYVAEMSKETHFSQNIPNAWFASSPGHPFWIFFTKIIQQYVFAMAPGEYVQPEQVAGPMLLKQSLDAWNGLFEGNGDPTIAILKAGTIYVDDWHAYEGEEKREEFKAMCPKEDIHQNKVNAQCKQTYPKAFALTFWTHSWGR